MKKVSLLFITFIVLSGCASYGSMRTFENTVCSKVAYEKIEPKLRNEVTKDMTFSQLINILDLKKCPSLGGHLLEQAITDGLIGGLTETYFEGDDFITKYVFGYISMMIVHEKVEMRLINRKVHSITWLSHDKDDEITQNDHVELKNFEDGYQEEIFNSKKAVFAQLKVGMTEREMNELLGIQYIEYNWKIRPIADCLLTIRGEYYRRYHNKQANLVKIYALGYIGKKGVAAATLEKVINGNVSIKEVPKITIKLVNGKIVEIAEFKTDKQFEALVEKDIYKSTETE